MAFIIIWNIQYYYHWISLLYNSTFKSSISISYALCVLLYSEPCIQSICIFSVLALSTGKKRWFVCTSSFEVFSISYALCALLYSAPYIQSIYLYFQCTCTKYWKTDVFYHHLEYSVLLSLNQFIVKLYLKSSISISFALCAL